MNKHVLTNEDKRRIKEVFHRCIAIKPVWCSGEATQTGRTDRFTIVAVYQDGMITEGATRGVADLCGYRLNKVGQIVISGCGYSKSHALGTAIMRLLGRDDDNTAREDNVNPKVTYD